VDVDGSVNPSVVVEPAVLLLGERGGPESVVLKSMCARPFEVLSITSNERIQASLTPPDGGPLDRREITVVATEADDMMPLVPVHVEVRTEGSTVVERLTLSVRLPTHALHSAL
jgi:hypothetical protein